MEKFIELVATKDSTPDHQYLLKPVSGQGRLVLRQQITTTIPKLEIELLFDELGFVIDEDQYRDTLSMVDLFHFYTRQHQYRKLRPPEPEFEENKSRALLNFAFTAIRKEVHERHHQWSWDHFRERRNDRREYVKLFKLFSTSTLPAPNKHRLEELECKLGYKDIRFYRSIARSEMRKERAEQKAAQPQAAHGGWMGWIWGSGSKSDSSGDGGNTEGLNDQQRKELYEAIDFDEKAAIASAVDVPREAQKLKLTVKLDTGSFALRRDPHNEAKMQDIIKAEFGNFKSDFVQRMDNFDAEISLLGMKVFDGTRKGSLHPQIVRVKEASNEAINSVEKSDQQEAFFFAKFEHQPLDERADSGLTVNLKSMEIIYHRGYVEEIVKFFKPPESQLESVNALLDVASETLEGIRKETRAGLEYALQKHKTVRL